MALPLRVEKRYLRTHMCILELLLLIHSVFVTFVLQRQEKQDYDYKRTSVRSQWRQSIIVSFVSHTNRTYRLLFNLGRPQMSPYSTPAPPQKQRCAANLLLPLSHSVPSERKRHHLLLSSMNVRSTSRSSLRSLTLLPRLDRYRRTVTRSARVDRSKAGDRRM